MMPILNKDLGPIPEKRRRKPDAMRNRKRSYNSKPFLVIGGPHDGQTVNVLAAPIAPIENVIRLPVPRKISAADFMPAHTASHRRFF